MILCFYGDSYCYTKDIMTDAILSKMVVKCVQYSAKFCSMFFNLRLSLPCALKSHSFVNKNCNRMVACQRSNVNTVVCM